ncbi:MAG: dTDP-4-dehydrorhamnose reductase [Acidobacteriota bacterium]|nr:dTDP-4-dehydrorhamnose reductase [Acidobacteriota bacterium]
MILVTGASGLLGASFVSVARQYHRPLVALSHQHPVAGSGLESVTVDLTDQQEVEKLLHSLRPTWIVHCAALTDVDGCEEQPDKARLINTTVSRNLAREARILGAGLVYISTDSVFDGEKGDYSEDDIPNPLNVYAQSKLAGEQAVREELAESLIVRTNIYGWNVQKKLSLAEWMLARFEAQQTIPAFEDVIFSPILVNDLSEILLNMMERRMTGLYHVTGSESCSKHQFALNLATVFGMDRQLVKATSIADSSLKAPRPRNTSLSTVKVERTLGKAMPDLLSGLKHFKALRGSQDLTT